MNDKPSNRVDWIDATKGLMIILVVFGHTWRGMFNSGLLPENLFEQIDSRIYAFHMPVFFALAGWFFLASLTRLSLLSFTTSRFSRLLWPMILWTYIFFGIKLLAGQYTNTSIDLADLLMLPIPGKAHFWFLWALLVMSFFFLWMKPFLANDGFFAGLLAVAAGTIVVIQFINWSPEALKWINSAVKYVPFFFVGMVFGHYGWLSKTPPPLRVLSGISFCILLAFWPTIAANGWAKEGSLVLTMCALSVLSNIGSKTTIGPARFLCQLGADSMAIFLAHTIFAAGLREILLATGVNNPVLHAVSGTLIGLIAPLILLNMAQRTGTTRLFGF